MRLVAGNSTLNSESWDQRPGGLGQASTSIHSPPGSSHPLSCQHPVQDLTFAPLSSRRRWARPHPTLLELLPQHHPALHFDHFTRISVPPPPSLPERWVPGSPFQGQADPSGQAVYSDSICRSSLAALPFPFLDS